MHPAKEDQEEEGGEAKPNPDTGHSDPGFKDPTPPPQDTGGSPVNLPHGGAAEERRFAGETQKRHKENRKVVSARFPRNACKVLPERCSCASYHQREEEEKR